MCSCNARLMMSNLMFITLVYVLDVCMIVCICKHACQQCTCKIWIACILMCMQIVSQEDQHKPAYIASS